MLLSNLALEASVAYDMAVCGYVIVCREAANTFANFYNPPGKLVSDNQGKPFYPLLCPGIPLVNMEVCTADRGGSHPDQDFVILYGRDIHRCHLKPRTGSCLEDGLHPFSHFHWKIPSTGLENPAYFHLPQALK